jgi:hypothetical protein
MRHFTDHQFRQCCFCNDHSALDPHRLTQNNLAGVFSGCPGQKLVGAQVSVWIIDNFCIGATSLPAQALKGGIKLVSLFQTAAGGLPPAACKFFSYQLLHYLFYAPSRPRKRPAVCVSDGHNAIDGWIDDARRSQRHFTGVVAYRRQRSDRVATRAADHLLELLWSVQFSNHPKTDACLVHRVLDDGPQPMLAAWQHQRQPHEAPSLEFPMLVGMRLECRSVFAYQEEVLLQQAFHIARYLASFSFDR